MDLGRSLDKTTLMLLYLDRHSPLVELYLAVGAEALATIMHQFAGSTLEIPTSEELERVIRDVHVYYELSSDSRDREGQRGSTVNALSVEYSISASRVRAIFVETSRRLERLQDSQESWAQQLFTRPSLTDEEEE